MLLPLLVVLVPYLRPPLRLLYVQCPLTMSELRSLPLLGKR